AVTLIQSLGEHADDVNCVAASRHCLATCSSDKTVRAYALDSLREMPFSPIRAHTYAVHCCCFNPDGSLLATCSTEGTTALWDARTGQRITVLLQPGGGSGVRVCAFSPRPLGGDAGQAPATAAPPVECLLSGSTDGTLALWDVRAHRCLKVASLKDGSVSGCAFSPCGRAFVTGSTIGELSVWDAVNMRCLHTTRSAHDLGVTAVSFSPPPRPVAGVERFETQRSIMASCGQDNKIALWTLALDRTGDCLTLRFCLEGHTAPVLCCCFSSDGHVLASGSVDKSVILWNPITGEKLLSIMEHQRYVTSCAFTPGAPYLITGSMDKTVKLWRLENTPTSQGCGCDGGSGYSGHCTGGSADAVGHRAAMQWSVEDVTSWLHDEGLAELTETFRNNHLDGQELLLLEKKSLGAELNIESLGLRNKLWRKLEELRSLEKTVSDTDVPDEFLCPISRELMHNPVIAADGYSYEKKEVEAWLHGRRRTSPMTNLPLESAILIPNRALQAAIRRWLESR
uniref:WD repeat, SAM and U-box domain-containing protein 1 n=1 Tax=Petromyzon marinus TaxID=7757 RepID=S4RSC4_PETMA